MARTLVQYFFLMFISPILSLSLSLGSSLPSYTKRWLFILFITIFGSNLMMNEGADAYRHLERVSIHYYDLSIIQFLEECRDIIFFIENKEVNEDLYIHFVSYFTGGILRAPGLFFVFIAFIYAYFFTGSLFKVINLKKGEKYNWFIYAFIVIFFLWKGIEGINTVRTWTGLWILFYGCISYYQTKKWKYILLMFVPVHVHIAYFAMAIPAWIVLIFGSRKVLYLIAFAASLAATNVSHESVLEQLQTTEVGAQKAKGYYIENEDERTEQIEQVVSQKGMKRRWYQELFRGEVHHLGINFLIIFIIISGIFFKHLNDVETKLFLVGLLTKALGNAAWFIYALNNRAEVVSGVFILGAFILFFSRTNYFNQLSKLKRQLLEIFLFFNLFLFLPYMIYKCAEIIIFLSAYNFFLPFVPWFLDINTSVRDILGFFIGK